MYRWIREREGLVGRKMMMTTSVLLALASAFLLAVISYVLFPVQPSNSKPLPVMEPLSDQIVWVVQWIGLAALIAITVVGTMLIVSQIRSKKNLNSYWIRNSIRAKQYLPRQMAFRLSAYKNSSTPHPRAKKRVKCEAATSLLIRYLLVVVIRRIRRTTTSHMNRLCLVVVVPKDPSITTSRFRLASFW